MASSTCCALISLVQKYRSVHSRPSAGSPGITIPYLLATFTNSAAHARVKSAEKSMGPWEISAVNPGAGPPSLRLPGRGAAATPPVVI